MYNKHFILEKDKGTIIGIINVFNTFKECHIIYPKLTHVIPSNYHGIYFFNGSIGGIYVYVDLEEYSSHSFLTDHDRTYILKICKKYITDNLKKKISVLID